MPTNFPRFRIGAVSYLNTLPLVWGMLEGRERDQVDLSFSLPSVCSEELERAEIQIGLVPVVEISRQKLEAVPGVGIACLGAVRSILLFSRVPWAQVRRLAADSGSRTSVELARVILRERFGVQPEIIRHDPQLGDMLSHADAALLIGDAALRADPASVPFECLDLGAEWLSLTGLPFVFAAWAGKPGIPVDPLSALTRASYEFGQARIDEIAAREYASRGISLELAQRYLRHHIRYELGSAEQQGLDLFLRLADLARPAVAACL